MVRSPQAALLPLSLDSPHHIQGARRFFATRRARYLSALAAGLCVCLLFFTFSGAPRKPSLHWIPGLAYDDPNRPPPPPITFPEPAAGPVNASTWQQRADQVKAAFVRAYAAYEKTAYPHDELKPLSGGTRDNLNGWGASLVDGFDTMVLMGLDDLSNRSVEHVAKLSFEKDQYVQFFETVIRYLGGLLSAYALTNKPIFLARADDLGSRLLPIFNTTTGLPPFGINPKKGAAQFGWMGGVAILSEFASCQMEYRYLAHLTGRPEYVKNVDRLTEFLRFHAEKGGLFPLSFSLSDGRGQGDMFSVGARADSAYEYLLKQWLMTGRTEPHFLEMYLRSANAIIDHMLYVSPQRQLLYVTDVHRISLKPKGDFQHLSCFLAGLFALGAATIPDVDPRHAWAAEGLAHTCWITYADSATGLGPESIRFSEVGNRWVDELATWERGGRQGSPPGVDHAQPIQPGEAFEYRYFDSRYLLRPETIESFYILWRTTGDAKWRDRGWALFDAIEKQTRTKDAYASINHVNKSPSPREDDMPSFFFAETLKYAYLMFIDEDKIPLDKWTLNTEAHPFPVFTWESWEKTLFKLS